MQIKIFRGKNMKINMGTYYQSTGILHQCLLVSHGPYLCCWYCYCCWIKTFGGKISSQKCVLPVHTCLASVPACVTLSAFSLLLLDQKSLVRMCTTASWLEASCLGACLCHTGRSDSVTGSRVTGGLHPFIACYPTFVVPFVSSITFLFGIYRLIFVILLYIIK